MTDDQKFISTAVCPFCLGRRGTCHVCYGEGRLDLIMRLPQAVRFVWAFPGCSCDACRRAGPQPGCQITDTK